MRLFIDTNVLIDYLGGRGDDGRRAQRMGLTRLFGDAELWVSGKSYTDAAYVLRRYLAPAQVKKGILDSLALFQVCSLEEQDIVDACNLQREDFEDALIEVSARKVGADYLVTRDSTFAPAKPPTITPHQVFTLLEKQGISYTTIAL
jgi:predicted nucleic acid-binding protein